MIDLTIDTCLLVDASQKGDPTWAVHSLELLTEFDRNLQLSLAVDRFVLYEYDQNINASMFASAWLKKFAARIKSVKVEPLPRGLRARLDEAHFSQPDRRFVQVALCTQVRLIVTRDPDYSPLVKQILQRHGGLRVLEPRDALQLVRCSSL